MDPSKIDNILGGMTEHNLGLLGRACFMLTTFGRISPEDIAGKFKDVVEDTEITTYLSTTLNKINVKHSSVGYYAELRVAEKTISVESIEVNEARLNP